MIDDEELDLGRVGSGQRCDLGLVDGLLRLQLAARRLGWSLRLVDVTGDLCELLQLVGLLDVLSTECPPAEDLPTQHRDGPPNRGS